jgi:hypothetical protein
MTQIIRTVTSLVAKLAFRELEARILRKLIEICLISVRGASSRLKLTLAGLISIMSKSILIIIFRH